MKRRIFVPLAVTVSLLFSVAANSQAGDCRYRSYGSYYGGYRSSDVAAAGLIGLFSGLLIANATRPAYYPPPQPVYAAPVYRSAPVYRRTPVVVRSSYRTVRTVPSHRRVYVGRVCR